MLPEGPREEHSRLTYVIARLRHFLAQGLWEHPLTGLPWWRRFAYRWLRIAVLSVGGFQRQRGHFLAFALTYMTLLSIVPLLAFAFAIAKGLKAQDRLRPFVEQQFGSGLKQVTDSLFEAVKNTNAATLSSFGLVIFLWAVVRGLSTFESAFNIIWGVRKSRSLVRKFTDYLSVLAVSPVLLVAAIGLTGLVASSTFAQDVLPSAFLRMIAGVLPFVVTWAGYTFLYKFLPNTRVRLRSALVGGILAGTAYQIVQWGYFHFQIGISRFNVIYGALASLPIFLIWLQLGWMIVLIGCEIAYVHQHEDTLRLEGLVARASVAERERQALRIVTRVTDQFLHGGEPWGKNSLAKALDVHFQLVSELVDRLVETRLLAETAGTAPRIVLARDPDRTSAADVIDAVRRHGLEWPGVAADEPQERAVARVLSKSRQVESGILSRYTLRTLADRSRPQPDEDRPVEPAIT